MPGAKKVENIHVGKCPTQGDPDPCVFAPDLFLERMEEQRQARICTLANLGEAVKGLAQEINDPLEGIVGAVRILAHRVETDGIGRHDRSAGELLTGLREQVSRLEDTVYDMLQCLLYAIPQPADMRVADALEETVSMLAERIREKKITVDISHAPDLPPIRADEGLVRQVFLDVIQNALDAMDDGGTLSIHSCRQAGPTPGDGRPSFPRCSGNRLMVYIRDTGCGIEPRSLETIFMPFRATIKKRAGISLYIAHHIIEQHRGILHIDSEPGKGTTVAICFPLPLAPEENGKFTADAS